MIQSWADTKDCTQANKTEGFLKDDHVTDVKDGCDPGRGIGQG